MCWACLYGNEDLKKASELMVAANQAFAEGHYQMGIYLELADEIQENKVRAFEAFLRGANLEHEPSISKVGMCYENGMGVEKNMEKAKEYYSLVAAKSDGADKKREKEIDSIAGSADSKRNKDCHEIGVKSTID